jgi:hypothetical protein
VKDRAFFFENTAPHHPRRHRPRVSAAPTTRRRLLGDQGSGDRTPFANNAIPSLRIDRIRRPSWVWCRCPTSQARNNFFRTADLIDNADRLARMD